MSNESRKHLNDLNDALSALGESVETILTPAICSWAENPETHQDFLPHLMKHLKAANVQEITDGDDAMKRYQIVFPGSDGRMLMRLYSGLIDKICKTLNVSECNKVTRSADEARDNVAFNAIEFSATDAQVRGIAEQLREIASRVQQMSKNSKESLADTLRFCANWGEGFHRQEVAKLEPQLVLGKDNALGVTLKMVVNLKKAGSRQEIAALGAELLGRKRLANYKNPEVGVPAVLFQLNTPSKKNLIALENILGEGLDNPVGLSR